MNFHIFYFYANLLELMVSSLKSVVFLESNELFENVQNAFILSHKEP